MEINQFKEYFNVNIYSLDELLKEHLKLQAHTHKNKKEEILEEHLNRTLYMFSLLCKKKNINKIIKGIISRLKFGDEVLSNGIQNMIYEMFINAIYLHDIGKINPAFQNKIMGNVDIDFKDSPQVGDSSHSLISSIVYMDVYFDRIKDFDNRKQKKVLRYVLCNFAYIISRHHTYLENLVEKDYIYELEKLQEKLKEEHSYIHYYKYSNRLIEKLKLGLFSPKKIDYDNHNEFEFFILAKLLYSSIVTCDSYATYFYDTGSIPDFKCIEDVGKYFEIYKSMDIYKGIKKYEQDKNYFGKKSINSLRTEIFLETEKNLLKNLDKNIFYLEAPTGSGKTNTSINLALNIIKEIPSVNKIYYVFPFNTLVEQTKKRFDDIFNKDENNLTVAVINSIAPIITEDEENCEEDFVDYKKDYLNRQMLHYPVTLTTHVNFFNYLFGYGREISLPLVHLCNSVIIMDEIQSYRNSIWPEIINFLNAYSRFLNIKIIIMSATLPKLDELLGRNELMFCDLIKYTKKYYENPLFKNRVSVDFSLLNKGKIEFKTLIDKIKELYKERERYRILMEFISKTTARKFFNDIKEVFPNKRIVELTGDDNNYERNKIINEINKKDKEGEFILDDVIVVATQVIEAGVDIDMDIGFKNKSLLDSEEQFLGRINRSCKRKGCIAYFFELDEPKNIYREDLRLEKDVSDKTFQKFLIKKDFQSFYNRCFRLLKDKKNELNSNNIKEFYDNIMFLNYKNISEHMKLIVQQNYQIYLAYYLGEVNGEILRGDKIWEDYKILLKDTNMEYSKKKIELSRMAEKMSYFIYNYIDYSDKYNKKPKFFNEKIGDIYYIKNGERFLTKDKKFDRDKYNRIVD